MLISSQLSLQINTPLWKFNCSEHSVFGNDITDFNQKDFDVSFADTSTATIKLHYVITDKNLVFIDEISCEYRCDMERYINKMMLLRKCVSITIITLVAYFVLTVHNCSVNYITICYIFCFYGVLIAYCNMRDFQIENEIIIKKM